MYTDWPGIYSYAELNDRLFTNPGRNDHINDTPSPGGYFSPAYYVEWEQQGLYTAQFVGSEPCRITMTLEATLMRFEACQGATRGGRTERITWTSETLENQAWRGSAQSGQSCQQG